MEPEKNIENQLEQLAQAIPSGTSFVDGVMNRIETSSDNLHKQSIPISFIRRIFMKTSVKVAAAAIVLIAALLSLILFDKIVTPAYAIEQTVEAMKHLETMHFFGRNWDNHEYEMWFKLDPKTGTPHYVYANYYTIGRIDITRPDKSYQYNAKANRVLINSGKLYHIGAAPAKIFEYMLQVSKTNGSCKVNIYHEQDAETKKTLIVMVYDDAREAFKAYIDPDTKLPVRMVGLKNESLGKIFKDIERVEYNVKLPEGIFDFHVTDDMEVVDMDDIMQKIDDPQNGISGEGLTEQEAAEKLVTDYWNALIANDTETTRRLSPAGMKPVNTDSSKIVSLEKVGKLYIQNGCGIGKVVPCQLRFTDGSLKEIKLVIRSHIHNNQPSYIIAGSWGDAVTIKE
jgi:hypothetical protein